MAIALVKYQTRGLLFELWGKRTTLPGHQTPLHGEHSLAARIDAMSAGGVQSLIVDTQTEHALAALARATLRSDAAFFWVGSGGLAREIAKLEQHENMRTAKQNGANEGAFPGGPILILVGSLSSVSERQCAVLCERGDVDEQVVPPAVLREGASHHDWGAWQQQIAASMRSGRDLLLRIGRDDAFDPAEGMQLSTALAALVEPHFATTGGLVATGGETARAMLMAARITNLHLLAEVEAGVVVARPVDATCEHRPGIVTKAGGFGTDQALYLAWLTLRNEIEPGVSPGGRP